MTHYALLLKKQFGDMLPARNKRKFGLSSFLPALLMLVLIAGIIAAFVFIFGEFTRTYTGIKINRVTDIAARQYELMTIAYFALVVAFVLSGVNRLCYTLFENSDVNVLISMPFSAFDIFSAKITAVYIRQFVLALACVLTVNLTFFVTTNTISAYNVLMSFAVAILLPILPLGIASVLVLPFYLIKRFVSSRYILAFVVMTVIMAAFCVGYYFVFDFAHNLLGGGGRLASLFNESVMERIINFTTYAYPANLIANVMLGREIGKNLGIFAAIVVGSAVIGMLIIHAIFIKATQSGFAPRIPHVHTKEIRLRKSSRMGSLIAKEFLIVLRTPGYSYMYFTTAIIMPIMVYFSARLGGDMLTNLSGISANFELCTFLVLLYSALTNTFCSTNISRDGYMIMMQKTLPYSPAQILTAKMIFGSLVSELSIIVSAVALAATKLETPVEAVITALSASLLAFAQLTFATRLDLNHPHFSKTDDGEIKEANSNVSTIIVIGLATSVIIGALLMLGPLGSILNIQQLAGLSVAVRYAIAIAAPLALLGFVVAFFFIGLKKVYSNLDAEY